MSTYDLPAGDPRVQAVAVAVEPWIIGNAERVAIVAISALRKYLESVKPVVRYTLTLNHTGDKKIQCIKEVRSISRSLGLKEAKDLVEDVDRGRTRILRSDFTYDEVRLAEAAFDYIGASVNYYET